MIEIAKLHHISQETNTSSHIDSIKRALDGGVTWSQLRVKNKTEDEVKQLALKAKELCKSYNATLIINDYLQICKELDLDGVHLGLTDTSTADARRILGDSKIVGGTANTFNDVMHHYKNGVNYVGIGPYRFTKTKDKLSPIVGLAGYGALIKLLKEQKISLHIIGIGGITLDDIRDITDAGIHGIAIASLINLDANPENIAQSLIKALY